MSFTSRWASMACWEWCSVSARVIWLFQSGMVFTMEERIFSAMTESLFCIMRICGDIWTDTMRVSSRSCSFFSNRPSMLA